MKDLSIIALSVCVIVLLVWLIFFPREKIVTQTFIKEQRDTVTVIDTQFIEKPVPIYIKSEPDTIYIPSIDSTVVLDKETKVYSDSTFEVQISGFQPQLDFIRVFPKTTYITTEKTLETVKKKRFTQGIQAGIGYGIINKKADIYVGYGIQYNF